MNRWLFRGLTGCFPKANVTRRVMVWLFGKTGIKQFPVGGSLAKQPTFLLTLCFYPPK